MVMTQAGEAIMVRSSSSPNSLPSFVSAHVVCVDKKEQTMLDDSVDGIGVGQGIT